MKQALFTFFLFCIVGLMSCRKAENDQDIKQYDETQIQNYIKDNSLTGMIRDKTGGVDTTGIYYKILNPGAGTAISYPDKILIVFSVKSFDGKFSASDTISNHVYEYLGHITSRSLPKGLELALLNILKYRGAQARLLIPSRLGYGISGYGSGSTSGNNRIAGNESLDYTVSIIDNSVQDRYDKQSIEKYIAANNLTGFVPTASGLYYKIVKAGTGTVIPTATSTVTVQYTGRFLNGTMFDAYNTEDGTGASFNLADVIPGWQEGLLHGTDGAKISLIVPSSLAYKETTGTGSIPAYSVLYFDINLLTVTN